MHSAGVTHRLHYLKMKKSTIHENLNTSFVNLPALVRHLRGMQFVGSIHIETLGYEADIEFTGTSTMRACETDHVAGLITYGETALRRILERSKEPGGLIHVYQGQAHNRKRVFVDRSIASRANRSVSGMSDTRVRNFEKGMKGGIYPHIKFKTRRKRPELETPENWTELLNLISELLRTVDDTMSEAHINFADAFRNACGFISADYPFLDPDSDVFSYADGFISVRRQLASQDLASGIVAALGRIFERLAEDAYFENVYRLTMKQTRALVIRRKQQFEKFSITEQLEEVTGN